MSKVVSLLQVVKGAWKKPQTKNEREAKQKNRLDVNIWDAYKQDMIHIMSKKEEVKEEILKVHHLAYEKN